MTEPAPIAQEPPAHRNEETEARTTKWLTPEAQAAGRAKIFMDAYAKALIKNGDVAPDPAELAARLETDYPISTDEASAAAINLASQLAGITDEMAAARIQAAFGPCAHPRPTPVNSGGERVAVLCPDCDTQLPAEWETP